MSRIHPALLRHLQQLEVRWECPDADTMVLREVPVGDGFNKPRTSLLVRQPTPGLPLIVGVDEDLEYCGPDAQLVQMFRSATRERGWRVLVLLQPARDLNEALRAGLRTVGVNAPGSAPSSVSEDSAGAGAINLTERVRRQAESPGVGRDGELGQALAALLCRSPRMALIAGASGAGRSWMLDQMARRLLPLRPAWRVTAIHVPGLFAGALFAADCEKRLDAALREAGERPGTVLAFETVELLASAPHGLHLLARAMEGGLRLLGTALAGSYDWILAPPMTRRVSIVRLEELGVEETTQALLARRPVLARHHNVKIPEGVARHAVACSLRLAGALPGKALTILDQACAYASLAGARAVTMDCLRRAEATFHPAEPA